MKILKLEGSAIHGYLNKKISFYSDLTFLTGINGSGKTSVINSLIALLTPSLLTLAELDYRTLKVDFENDGYKSSIEATKEGDQVYLSNPESEEAFVYSRYSSTSEVPLHRAREQQIDYYRELISTNSSHPVLRYIDSLPTPMFLDLERRARYLLEQQVSSTYLPTRILRSTRNVFSASLSTSLADAVTLAESSYKDASISTNHLGEILRQELVLSMLPAEAPQSFGQLAVPTNQDKIDIRLMRDTVNNLPKILNLPAEEVKRKVTAFLNILENYLKQIPKDASVPEIFKNNKPDSPVVAALFGWSLNNTQLAKFRAMMQKVQKFSVDRKEINSKNDRYLSTVNKFLLDSGKSIAFSERGNVTVEIVDSDEVKSVASLSSGEAQIFVILTQLLFNPNAETANIFVIDEPELSLHVQWQEIFVDSVIEANPKVQFIMATHSPSIILDKVKKCRDLSPKIARRSNA